ncbi:MAG: Gfo/Idh/MocA family oxidoreductase [Thermomicrobiales bacterium]
MASTPVKGILIGAGGFGGAWVRAFLPAMMDADRVRIVGIADVNVETLAQAGDLLGVPEEARFTDPLDLIASTDAKVAFVVIPLAARTPVVRAAAERGIHVLCEKPVAASWTQTLEIGRIVQAAGIKFAIMQNSREQNRIRTLKAIMQRPELRNVNLIECRFAVNYTIETAGGAFRHQIPDAFIYEGAEHHLDQLRNLTGAEAGWVQGFQWGMPWSTFGVLTCLSQLIRMTNGTMVQYTMNHIEWGHQNGWHEEYYRVSTEGGTLTLDADNTIRLAREGPGQGEVAIAFEPIDGEPEEHIALIGTFLDWVEGGDAPFNTFADNVKMMALTFAAVEATHTGARVDVQAMLDAAVASGELR